MLVGIFVLGVSVFFIFGDLCMFLVFGFRVSDCTILGFLFSGFPKLVSDIRKQFSEVRNSVSENDFGAVQSVQPKSRPYSQFSGRTAISWALRGILVFIFLIF